MGKISFKKTLFFWVVLSVLFTSFVVAKAIRLTPSKERKYEEMVAKQPRNERKEKLKKTSELSSQTRYDVQKTFYASDGDLRPITYIEAEESAIKMYMQKRDVEVIEIFSHPKGVVQKELFYIDENQNESKTFAEGLRPMQRYRFFEAERAVYDFQKDVLVAYDVIFWTYEVEGHDLLFEKGVKEPIAKGKASSMRMQEKLGKKKTPEMYAENLQITILNDKGVW